MALILCFKCFEFLRGFWKKGSELINSEMLRNDSIEDSSSKINTYGLNYFPVRGDPKILLYYESNILIHRNLW